MPKFKMKSSIAIIIIEAFELNINPGDYGIQSVKS
jgi:hypothetical protein